MSSTHSVAGFFGVPMFICAALKQLAVWDWLWAWGAPRQLDMLEAQTLWAAAGCVCTCCFICEP